MATKWYRAKENQPALIGAGGAVIVALITGVFLLGNGCFSKAKPEPEKLNQSSNSPNITGSQNSVTYSQQNDNHSQNVTNYNVNLSAALMFGLPATTFFLIFGGIYFFHRFHSAKVAIEAAMPLKDDENGRRILVEVTAVNSGRRPCHVKNIALFLQPTTMQIPGSDAPKLESSPDEEHSLSNPPASQQGVVELKADGGPKTWTFPYQRNPLLRVYEKDGERYGNGRIELTTGQKIRFEFLMLPDDAWEMLTAPIAPVFGGKVGRKCPRCDFMYIIQADAKPVTCPKCGFVDDLKPRPQRQPAAKMEKIAAAAEAIRTAYLPIIGMYENCTLLVEDNNGEKLKARQSQFQGHVNNFWTVFDAKSVFLPTDIENDIKTTVNTCIHYVRLCDKLQVLADSKPQTVQGHQAYDMICLELEKAQNDIALALRPQVDKHFKKLIPG